MAIEFQPVTPETRHAFSAILSEANAWLKQIGAQGWSGSFDDAWMLPRIERGELWLAELDGEPVAAFRVLWRDEMFWRERETGDSIYLHSLAVQRSHAGRGIGEAVINEVAAMGRQQRRTKIRLDCFQTSAGLVTYYGRIGFASVGSIEVDGKALSLMERPI